MEKYKVYELEEKEGKVIFEGTAIECYEFYTRSRVKDRNLCGWHKLKILPWHCNAGKEVFSGITIRIQKGMGNR